MKNEEFPSHARGYLYYYLAPNAPALSGQLRFRVTATNDPALFSLGEDLPRTVDHIPWRIPVMCLPSLKSYTALLHRLVDDGLVSEHLSRVVSNLPPKVQTVNASSERIIHAFRQPFPLHFGHFSQPFCFVGADTARWAQMGPVAIAHNKGKTSAPMMTGSALCRFEKSTRLEHAGRRVVVCRAIRILEPMERTGIRPIPDSLLPREGELIRMTLTGGVPGPEWTFDVDRHLSLGPDARITHFALAEGFDLLYGNEERAGGPVGW